MDRSVEPLGDSSTAPSSVSTALILPVSLRLASLPGVTFLLSLVLAATVGFPALYALVKYLLVFDGESLSWIFFKILSRSLALTFIQALLSASLVLLSALILGTALALLRSRLFIFLANAMEALGAFAFVLPTLSVSLLVLDLSRHFWFLPSQGLAAIVMAHFLLNTLFVSSIVRRQISQWSFGAGRELCEAAATLGAQRFALYRNCFGEIWREIFRTWFPLIFLWSFGAFATVVILGGGPRLATPEVLLFYSLQNDLESGRILVLMLVQMGVAFFIVRKGLFKKQSPKIFTSSARGLESNTFFMNGGALKKLLVAVFGLPPVLALLWLVVAPLNFVLRGNAPSTDMVWAFAYSALLALFTGAFSFLWALALLYAGSNFRRSVFLLFGLSTTLLMSFWMALGFDLWLQDSVIGELLGAAFALSLVQIPLSAFWLERRIETLPDEIFEAAATLGCDTQGVLKQILRPQLKDVLWKVALVAAIGAVGELAIAQLFVRSVDLVAGLSQRLTLRYDFSGAYWVLLFLVVMTLLFYGLSRRLEAKH